MDRTQKNLKLLAVFAYAIMVLGLLVNFAYAPLLMVAVLIFAIVLSKQTEDHNAILPVVGAEVLYFGVWILQAVFDVIGKIVGRIDVWTTESISFEELLGMSTGGMLDGSGEFGLLERVANLLDRSLNAAEAAVPSGLDEVFTIIIFVISLAAFVFAIMSVVTLLSGKDFSKSLVGKIAAPFAMTKEVYYCANCGAAVKGGFCAKCGTKKPE